MRAGLGVTCCRTCYILCSLTDRNFWLFVWAWPRNLRVVSFVCQRVLFFLLFPPFLPQLISFTITLQLYLSYWVSLSCSLSPWRAGFSLRPVYVEFMLDRVAVGQVFLRVLRCTPVSINPPVLHARSFMNHWRYVISAVDSDVESHTIINSILTMWYQYALSNVLCFMHSNSGHTERAVGVGGVGLFQFCQ